MPTTTGEALADNTRFLDNQSLDGAVPDIIENALRAMRRNMKRRAIVIGAGREDRWEYPEAAIRELVTNALMHRDYHPAATGTQVRLSLFPDRLEVTSPGGLYGPVYTDALLTDHITSSRNTHLAKLFEDVLMPDNLRTVCENRGTGLFEVASSLRRAGMAPPEIHDNIRQFRVVVRNQVLLDEPARTWLSKMGATKLNERQQLALGYLFHYRQITQPRYRDVTGCDNPRATGDIASLCRQGLIRKIDTRGGGSWELADRSGNRTGPAAVNEVQGQYATLRRQSRQDRRAAICEALLDGEMSTAELSSLIGIGQPAVLRWLRRMESDAEVAPTEPDWRSRHNRWRLTSTDGH